MCVCATDGRGYVLPVGTSGCLRTTSESISGSHRGQGKAEASGVRAQRTVVTCDARIVKDVVVDLSGWPVRGRL